MAQIELFHVYTEFGYRGEKEVNTTYTLTIGEGNALAQARLKVETDTRSFPANGDATADFEEWEISVQALAELVQKHGKRV
jgi:hypothetical protein